MLAKTVWVRETDDLKVPRTSTYLKIRERILKDLERSDYLSRTQLRMGVQDAESRMCFEAALYSLQDEHLICRLYDTNRVGRAGYHPELYMLEEKIPLVDLPVGIYLLDDVVARIRRGHR